MTTGIVAKPVDPEHIISSGDVSGSVSFSTFVTRSPPGVFQCDRTRKQNVVFEMNMHVRVLLQLLEPRGGTVKEKN
jgi:hypothetical protein